MVANNTVYVIAQERRECKPSPSPVELLVREYTAGRVPDYQMAAFLMAVTLRGMNAVETRALTLALRDSGETLVFPEDPRPLVDKHSTWGVGG